MATHGKSVVSEQSPTSGRLTANLTPAHHPPIVAKLEERVAGSVAYLYLYPETYV